MKIRNATIKNLIVRARPIAVSLDGLVFEANSTNFDSAFSLINSPVTNNSYYQFSASLFQSAITPDMASRFTNNDITFEVLMYSTAAGTVIKENSNQGYTISNMEVYNDKLVAGFWAGTQAYFQSNIDRSNWHLYTYTYVAGGSLTVYQDGVQVGQQNIGNKESTRDDNNTTLYYFFCDQGPSNFGHGNYLDANIAAVRIYNRTLSSDEVAINYQATRAVTTMMYQNHQRVTQSTGATDGNNHYTAWVSPANGPEAQIPVGAIAMTTPGQNGITGTYTVTDNLAPGVKDNNTAYRWIKLVGAPGSAGAATVLYQNDPFEVYWDSESPVIDGLVVSLDANEFDISPDSTNAWVNQVTGPAFTLPNGAVYTSTNGGNLSFIKSVQQSAHGTSVDSALTTFTAETWVYFNSVPTTSGQATCTITEAYNGNPINYTIACGAANDPTLWQGGYFDGGAWHLAGNFRPNLNTWYCLAVTYDGTNVKFYVNGSVNDTVASSVTPASGGAGIHIGERWDAPQYADSFLDGSVPVVKLYNRALTPAEIAQNFRALRGRFGL